MLFRSLPELLITIPAILIAITFHEYAHGKTAALLGDPTPKAQGRLTLNPLAHLDPLGTLMLLVARFGWAKPVQVNPLYFRGDRQRGMLLVALAGPLMNLVLAYLAAVGLRLAIYSGSLYVIFFLQTLIAINVYLAVFNLLPIPPLDGSKILAGLLPKSSLGFFYQLQTYGTLILILGLVTGIFWQVIGPVATAILKFIYTASGF